MGLKEQMAADVSAVFLNADEFADVHLINGAEMKCVVDKDSYRDRSNRMSQQYEGIHREVLDVYVKDEDLGYYPVYGQEFHLDGRTYLVSKVARDAGMFCITLEADQT